MSSNKVLPPTITNELLRILEIRFNKNMDRHKGLRWEAIHSQLQAHPGKLWSIAEMERTGGEPDIVQLDSTSKEIIFCDCSIESPKERRSLCFDRQALDERKEAKPANNVIDMSTEMGISLLNESQYRLLQQLGNFDLKTSSWIATPANIRKLGGALFCDRRYDTVFVYHNGASSYYAARGFRGCITL